MDGRERVDGLRLLEALLFASSEPLDEESIKARLPEETDLEDLLSELADKYADRGVNLVHVGGKWAFRTAPDVAPRLKIETTVSRRLSRAAVETLAIIAYHQPVTRAEIEEIRGVGQSRGTLDMLLEAGWIKPGRRRRTPGRPVTWVTTDAFLEHFGLPGLDALPGVDELKAAGLLDTRPAIGLLRERGELTPASEEEDADGAEEEESLDASDLQSNLLEAEEN
ncbi:MAG: SMC-Scp complex subunit ScpB [Alphaproteobacteria bacterium]|nr:SMC-Scp complex subunit ScpB [Alphaproteobacteria bacterium]